MTTTRCQLRIMDNEQEGIYITVNGVPLRGVFCLDNDTPSDDPLADNMMPVISFYRDDNDSGQSIIADALGHEKTLDFSVSMTNASESETYKFTAHVIRIKKWRTRRKAYLQLSGTVTFAGNETKKIVPPDKHGVENGVYHCGIKMEPFIEDGYDEGYRWLRCGVCNEDCIEPEILY